MTDQVRRALLWYASIPPVCCGRLMSVFPSDNSPTARLIPPETNKKPEKKTWRGNSERPCQMLSSPELGARFLFAFSPRRASTDYLFHAQSKHKWLSHQYSQPDFLLARRLPLRCPCVAASFCLIFHILHLSFSPPPAQLKIRNLNAYEYVYKCIKIYISTSLRMYPHGTGREESDGGEVKGEIQHGAFREQRAFSSCLVKNVRYVWVSYAYSYTRKWIHAWMGWVEGWMDGQTHTKTPCCIDQQHPEKLRANNVAPCRLAQGAIFRLTFVGKRCFGQVTWLFIGIVLKHFCRTQPEQSPASFTEENLSDVAVSTGVA